MVVITEKEISVGEAIQESLLSSFKGTDRQFNRLEIYAPSSARYTHQAQPVILSRHFFYYLLYSRTVLIRRCYYLVRGFESWLTILLF